MLEAIPEYWYVLYKNEEEFNIINDHFEKDWGFYPIFNNNCYTNICSTDKNNWVNLNEHSTYRSSGFNKDELDTFNAVEISFEDFVYYIIKGNNFIKKENTNYLELLLKKLNIQ